MYQTVACHTEIFFAQVQQNITTLKYELT